MVDDADHDFTGVMPNQLAPLHAAVADKDHAWTSEGMKRDPRWSRGNDMDPDPQDEAISDPPLIRNNKEPVICWGFVSGPPGGEVGRCSKERSSGHTIPWAQPLDSEESFLGP